MSRRYVQHTARSHGTCPGCGKQQYASERAAKRVARSLAQDGAVMTVYRCRRWWHAGSRDEFALKTRARGRRTRRKADTERATAMPVAA